MYFFNFEKRCTYFRWYCILDDVVYDDCANGDFMGGADGTMLTCPGDYLGHGTCGSGTKNNFCPGNTHSGIGCCRKYKLSTGTSYVRENEFDRFVDLNIRGAKRRVYSDLRIYCNSFSLTPFFLRLKIHRICADFIPVYCGCPDQYI